MVLELGTLAERYGKTPSELWELYGCGPLAPWERVELDRAAFQAVVRMQAEAAERTREVPPGKYEELKEKYMEAKRRARPEG